jgi:AcrR family transcriptional regulator
MARWKGDARGRLERAALSLFAEQGYDRTTVAQIARRAELTERSFYRWFTDKREVLFAGDELEARFLAAIEAVPADTAALPTLLAAFTGTPEVLRPREFLHHRAAVIAANPPLQERELIKLAALAEALAAALVRRGIDEPAARLAVDVGTAVLRLATGRWLTGEHADPAEFAAVLAASAADLLAVAATGVPDQP